MVSFYGASVTKEQSEKLQSVIMDLEKQGFVKATPDANGSYQAGDEALGSALEPGTYAQLGLKVSQLAYACKEMGLSDEAAEQITGAYGKQAEEKINKVNSMIEFAAKQIKIEQEKFYKEHGTPHYKKGVSKARNTTGKDSVEVNKETNSDIYNMFANLDVSSKEKFQSSFEKALAAFRDYFVSDPIEDYNGTDREQRQLDESYYSANFLKQLYKRGRKYGLCITGLTQNVEDLLRSEQARGMVGNSDFVLMLNQNHEDLEVLSQMLHISPNQRSYVMGADPGCGLIFAEKVIVPFVDRFPEGSYLYKLMSTRFGEDMDKDEVQRIIDGIVREEGGAGGTSLAGDVDHRLKELYGDGLAGREASRG